MCHDPSLTKLANHMLPRHHHLQPSSLPLETLGSHGNHHFSADNRDQQPSSHHLLPRTIFVHTIVSKACIQHSTLSSASSWEPAAATVSHVAEAAIGATRSASATHSRQPPWNHHARWEWANQQQHYVASTQQRFPSASPASVHIETTLSRIHHERTWDSK